MKIFSTDQIREIVKYTQEQDNVTELDLIARAAKGIAAEIEKRWNTDKRVVVFAGWGNNGADALATSQILLRDGYDVEIFLFNIGGSKLGKECAIYRDRLREEFPDAKLNEITHRFDMPELDRNFLVIDGLFGIGLNRTMPQSFSVIIRAINESGADIVSIDIPSGLLSDWNSNSINTYIIHATLTIAIGFPHLSFFIDDNAELIGEWIVINIGLNRKAISQAKYDFYLVTYDNVKYILRPRWPEHYKNEYGHALICAGSYGMMGAAILSARGCIRAGVGKLTCYAPRCGYFIMQTAVPSAMFQGDSHDAAISEITLQRGYDAVAIGPGIGTADITINALENFLKVARANSRPVVLDADALNCISLRPIMLDYLPVHSVLTPHAGEFDRLFGSQPSAEARLRKAIEVAQFYNIVIVLKGRYTAIVRPDGRVHLNSSGSTALATAGSGDVLTGVITALIAQRYTPETAALLGVFIHGVAGQLCEEEYGSYGTTAEDIALNIGRAIKHIME